MTAAAAARSCLGRLALSWLAIVAAAFVLLRLMPSDPVEVFLAHVNVRSGPEIVAAYRAQWGLDESLAAQFLRWLGGFVTFDWGVSFETGRPVAADFAARLPYSAAIGFGGMVLAVTGGFSLGFFAAHRPGGLADASSRGLAVAGQALPAFAVGLVLLWGPRRSIALDRCLRRRSRRTSPSTHAPRWVLLARFDVPSDAGRVRRGQAESLLPNGPREGTIASRRPMAITEELRGS